MIAGDEEEGEPFSGLNPALVATDDRDRIFVADPVARMVQVFGTDGRWLFRFGSSGEGPADFQFPVAVAVNDRRVRVYDMGLRRFVDFDTLGGFVASQSTPGTNLSGMDFLQGQPVYSVAYREEAPPVEELVVEGGEPFVMHRRTLPESRILDLRSCGVRIPGMPPVFSRSSMSWSTNGGMLALVDGVEYEIKVFRDGALKALVRRNRTPTATTSAMAVAEVRSGVYTERYGCDPEEIVEAAGVAGHIPTIQAVTVTRDGWLWVEKTDERIDVFRDDGRYLGTLPATFTMPAAFLGDGRHITIETDDLDVARLAIVDVVDR